MEKEQKGKINWRRYAYLAGGVVAVAIAVIAGAQWGSARENVMLAFLTVAMLPAGVFLLWKGIRRAPVDVVIVGADKAAEGANSLNIYARKDSSGKVVPDRVAFEFVKKPMGQPSQCVNDGNWYFTHILDLKTGKLRPFELPDSLYFDPAEFANVLTMPAHKRLFQRKTTMLQRIAPWVMLVALIAGIIGLVAVSGA